MALHDVCLFHGSQLFKITSSMGETSDLYSMIIHVDSLATACRFSVFNYA